MTATRTWIPVLALATGLACTTTPAIAQPYGTAQGWHGQQKAWFSAAWNNGYRAGFDRGHADSRSRHYDYYRDDVYRSGSRGYDRHHGSRDEYRRAFQQGFAAGYSDGFYGRGHRYGPTDPNFGRYPAYPPATAYPRAPSPYGYNAYGAQAAFDRGYREGIDKGRDDREDRHAYDPRGEKWYHQGDRGYKREYGPKEQYKAEYRDGFLRGYDEGYRRW